MSEREQILSALDRFTRQRAGLEFGNYGDVSAYRSEQRAITRDLHDFRTLLAAVSWRNIPEQTLKDAFRAFSGRLTWENGKLSYCTGQYFPTEYRKAACAVLASALWDYTRENMPPAQYQVEKKLFNSLDDAKRYAETFSPVFVAVEERRDGLTAGDWLRRYFRREFGRRIASRYFD